MVLSLQLLVIKRVDETEEERWKPGKRIDRLLVFFMMKLAKSSHSLI